jgi:hypothetical protein
MGRNIRVIRVACGALLALLPVAALAQVEPMLPLPAPPTAPAGAAVGPALPGAQPREVTSVLTRSRPEVDPIGLRAGSYFFYPKFEVDEIFNDNIFASTAGKVSDFITVLAPNLDVRSNFRSNMLNFSAGSVVGLYAQNSRANYQDAYATTDGRLDVDAGSDLHGTAKYTRSHLDFASPLAPGGIESPVITNAYGATAGYEQTGLRIGYSADLAATRNEYEAVPIIGGGLLPESNLNNTAYEAQLRAAYEFFPGYSVYVRGAYNLRAYDHGQSAAFPTLDSQGYRADVGGRINLTDLIYLDGYFGYVAQTYRAPQFGTIGGPDFGATVTWDVTTLTTLSLNALRQVQDANVFVVGNSPGSLHTAVGVKVDHELLRHLLLNANANYIHDDYQGISLADNGYTLGVGAKYLLNRHLYLGFNYLWYRYLPSGSAAGTGAAPILSPFTQNVATLRLSTQF